MRCDVECSCNDCNVDWRAHIDDDQASPEQVKVWPALVQPEPRYDVLFNGEKIGTLVGDGTFTPLGYRPAAFWRTVADDLHRVYPYAALVAPPVPTPDPFTDEMKARATGLSLAEIRALREENWA